MELTPEILKFTLMGAGAYFVLVFALGLANKVVLYADSVDFLVSLAPWAIPVITMMFLQGASGLSHNPEAHQELSHDDLMIFYTSIGVSGLFALWSLKMAVQANRNIFLGSLVWIFKLCVSLLSIFVLAGFVDNKNSSHSTNQLGVVIALGLCIWLKRKLFNADSVYASKGWDRESSQVQTVST